VAPVAPTTPAAPTLRASPAQPVANDRRAIQQRSPQSQTPAQVQRAPLPQPDLPVAAAREVAPPPPPPRPQQQQAPRPPPPHVPEKVKGEPP